MKLLGRAGTVLTLAGTLTAIGLAQVDLFDESIGGPLTRPPAQGAPFSADATTTVHATLGDGTQIEQSTTDRYYRDSAGRVRVERLMNGLPAPTTMSERHVRTVIAPDPASGGVYTLDPETRTARFAAREGMAITTGGSSAFAVPVGGVRFLAFYRAGDLLSSDPAAFVDARNEPLGRRLVAGVEVIGRRITIVVPPGYRRNDQPVEMIDERWESPELKLLIESRYSHSRSRIEYRLSNIHRTEPPADLFELPPDYTIDASSTAPDPIQSFADADSPHAGDFRADRRRMGATPGRDIKND